MRTECLNFKVLIQKNRRGKISSTVERKGLHHSRQSGNSIRPGLERQLLRAGNLWRKDASLKYRFLGRLGDAAGGWGGKPAVSSESLVPLRLWETDF